MTTDKKQVTADEIVANLKEFTDGLHTYAKDAMIDSLLEKDMETFVSANIIHNLTHDLMDILAGKSGKEVLDNAFTDDDDDEENGSFVGSIAVNVKTGQIDGIEDIKDPKLKEKIAEVVQKLADKLGGK